MKRSFLALLAHRFLVLFCALALGILLLVLLLFLLLVGLPVVLLVNFSALLFFGLALLGDALGALLLEGNVVFLGPGGKVNVVLVHSLFELISHFLLFFGINVFPILFDLPHLVVIFFVELQLLQPEGEVHVGGLLGLVLIGFFGRTHFTIKLLC